MRKLIFSVIIFLIFCVDISFAATQVILNSWDGVEYSVIEDLSQAGRLPNLSKLSSMNHMTCNRACDAFTVTKPQHAIMLTGETGCVTGISKNQGEETIPIGLTIYEKLPENISKAHLASKSLLDGNTFFNSVPVINEFFCAFVTQRKITNKALDLIDKWKDRDFFIFLHFHEPDNAGHMYGGIGSSEYIDELIENDNQLGRILKKIKKLSLNTKVITLSDHGFGCPDSITHRCSPNTFISGVNQDMDESQITPFILDIFIGGGVSGN